MTLYVFGHGNRIQSAAAYLQPLGKLFGIAKYRVGDGNRCFHTENMTSFILTRKYRFAGAHVT